MLVFYKYIWFFVDTIIKFFFCFWFFEIIMPKCIKLSSRRSICYILLLLFFINFFNCFLFLFLIRKTKSVVKYL